SASSLRRKGAGERTLRVEAFRLTRFQHRRDRVIGDSQVRFDEANIATLELMTDTGATGLGFMLSLAHPLPALAEIERVFRREAWRGREGEAPRALAHRLQRPRGGSFRPMALSFGESADQPLRDLAAE